MENQDAVRNRGSIEEAILSLLPDPLQQSPIHVVPGDFERIRKLQHHYAICWAPIKCD